MPRQQTFAAIIALVIATAAGCHTWDIKKTVPWMESDDPEIGVPLKMAVLWSDTVYCQAGQPPTRGFGGRIYFYDENNEAVAVEGELIVYAFDDTLQEANRDNPDRKYVFPEKEFATHFSPAKLGPSYSVWLPWDAVGGERREISLVPFFRPNSGQIIVGEQSEHALPGATPKQPTTPELTPVGAHARHATSSHRVRPASYVDEEQSLLAEESGDDRSGDQRRRDLRMETTTINVPPAVGQQWARDPRQIERAGQVTPASLRPPGEAPAPRPVRSQREASDREPADRSARATSPRFQRSRFPVPSVQDGRQGRVRAAWQPPRGSLPSFPQGLPPTARSLGPKTSWPIAPQSG
jgi:hypothetical protein